jgi:hypothetical protein
VSLDGTAEPKGWLFRSTRARSGELTGNPLSQADVYRMIRRRALAAPQRYATALCFLASLVYRPRHQCLGVRCMQLTHASLRTSRHISVPAFAWAA